MSDNKIAVTLNGRTVHWEVNEALATAYMQHHVQMLGPAKEGS